MTTPNCGIPEVPEGTLDPAAGLNLSLRTVDALLQAAVISMDLTAPPGSPADGDLYIVASPATGAWSGLEDHLVRYVAEGTFWQSFTPGEQVRIILNRDDGLIYLWLDDSPGSWAAYNPGSSAPSAPVVTESGTSRTATAADAGSYVRFTNGSAKTYTFDDAESYSVGDEFHGRNVSGADLTIAEAGAMGINIPAGGSLIVPAGGTFTVKIVASTEADLIGVTEAP